MQSLRNLLGYGITSAELLNAPLEEEFATAESYSMQVKEGQTGLLELVAAREAVVE
jgi:hypothetical protein